MFLIRFMAEDKAWPWLVCVRDGSGLIEWIDLWCICISRAPAISRVYSQTVCSLHKPQCASCCIALEIMNSDRGLGGWGWIACLAFNSRGFRSFQLKTKRIDHIKDLIWGSLHIY